MPSTFAPNLAEKRVLGMTEAPGNQSLILTTETPTVIWGRVFVLLVFGAYRRVHPQWPWRVRRHKSAKLPKASAGDAHWLLEL